MTDREVLETAIGIAMRLDWRGTAYDLKRIMEVMPPDPPRPPGKEVRIAVVCNEKGSSVSAYPFYNDHQTASALRCAGRQLIDGEADVAYRAIVTAVIPPVSIPVVEGRTESCDTQQ